MERLHESRKLLVEKTRGGKGRKSEDLIEGWGLSGLNCSLHS